MVSQVVVDDASNRILDATVRLIVDGGPGAASISAIASEAGVSRMTVYRRFDDRRSILAALLNRELGYIVARAAQVLAPTSRERIAEMMVVAVRGINDHPLVRAVLVHEPEVLTEWVTQRLGATQRLAQQVLRDQIIEGQRSGDGTVRLDDPDAMALTLVLIGQTFVFSQRLGGDPEQIRPLVTGYLT